MLEMMSKMHGFMLRGKPHIKEYYRLLNLHSEIISAMAQYDADGKFERIIEEVPQKEQSSTHGSGMVYLLQSEFDLDAQEDSQAYYDMVMYKQAPNMNCITEDFIQKHRYRRADKIELLHSMLHSKRGLLEVTGTDVNEGYAYLQDVLQKNSLPLRMWR